VSQPLWPDPATQPGGPHPDGLPTITPYLPPAPHAPVGAVVVCPGGGYSRRAPHEGEPVARWLVSLGLAAFVLDYRVAPARHPLPLGDVQRGVRTVRASARHWGVDPRRVAVLGFSAGGHLAATIATHFDAGDPAAQDAVERVGCRPDAAILCYPVITFGEQHSHAGSMRNLLGEDPSQELRRHLSNELQVSPQTPPTFLWHTAEDAAVPVENSLLFAAALAHHGVPFELHVFPRGRHGLGLAGDLPAVGAWTGLCRVWLDGLGFLGVA
jgi:acetyl esterase/lipase